MSDYKGIGPKTGFDRGNGFNEYDDGISNIFDARSQNVVMRMLVNAIKEGTGDYNDNDPENELARLVTKISFDPRNLRHVGNLSGASILVKSGDEIYIVDLDKIIQKITIDATSKTDQAATNIRNKVISELDAKVSEIENQIKQSINEEFEEKLKLLEVPDNKISFAFNGSNFSVKQSEFAKYDRLAIIAGSTHTVGAEVLDWHNGKDDFYITDDDGNSVSMDADTYIQWYKSFTQRAHE